MKETNGVVVELTGKEWEKLNDDCQEKIQNADGTLTYVFDEPFVDRCTNGVTVSKEAEEKAATEYKNYQPKKMSGQLAKVLSLVRPKF